MDQTSTDDDDLPATAALTASKSLNDPTDDLRVRSIALHDAALMMSRIMERGTDVNWAETQTVRVARRLERYLREGT